MIDDARCPATVLRDDAVDLPDVAQEVGDTDPGHVEPHPHRGVIEPELEQDDAGQERNDISHDPRKSVGACLPSLPTIEDAIFPRRAALERLLQQVGPAITLRMPLALRS